MTSPTLDVSPPPVSHSDSGAPREPEPDGVQGGVVVVVAIATLVVMACGVWVAWEIAGSPADDDPAGRWQGPSDEIQSIEMSLLPRSDAASEHRPSPTEASKQPGRHERDARQRLSSYGHSDRSRGTVHIPLARAKQLYLERERARAPAAESSSVPRRPR